MRSLRKIRVNLYRRTPPIYTANFYAKTYRTLPPPGEHGRALPSIRRLPVQRQNPARPHPRVELRTYFEVWPYPFCISNLPSLCLPRSTHCSSSVANYTTLLPVPSFSRMTTIRYPSTNSRSPPIDFPLRLCHAPGRIVRKCRTFSTGNLQQHI